MALIAGFFGGALGGLMSGAGYGLSCGAGVGCLAFALVGWRPGGWRLLVFACLTLGIPAVLAGAVGGTLGAALNEAVVTEWWGRLAGLLVGGVTGTILFTRRPVTWGVSFAAGIALGLWLVECLNVTQLHWAGGLTALVAGGFSELCRWIARSPAIVVGRRLAFAGAERRRIDKQARTAG